MYYRRYFEGTASGSTTRGVTFGGSTYVYNVAVERTLAIGRAVAETLKDAGMDSYYDEDNFMLYLKRGEAGIGLLTLTSLYTCWIFNSDNSTSRVEYNVTSTNSPFSGLNYKFYVTLLGEPTSLFFLGIGSWANPSYAFWGPTFGFGKNKKTGEKLQFFGQGNFGSSGFSTFYIRKTDGNEDQYSNAAKQIGFGTVQLQGFNNGVILKEVFDTTGMYTINNCYMGCKTISYGSTYGFYSINGEEYYSPNQYFIIKCPSKIVKRS